MMEYSVEAYSELCNIWQTITDFTSSATTQLTKKSQYVSLPFLNSMI